VKHRIANPNLPQLLLKARERLMSHFRPILSHFGLTEQQWRVMRVLDESGQLEPWEICEMCQILSPSMAGVLARMEEAALVQRTRMPEDQRRVIVRLAPEGERLLGEMAPYIDEQYQNIERTYGKRVFEDLFRPLQAFLDADYKSTPQVELPPRLKDASRRGGKK
jgi:homoprotocatechuate degradation regulator HpaR